MVGIGLCVCLRKQGYGDFLIGLCMRVCVYVCVHVYVLCLHTYTLAEFARSHLAHLCANKDNKVCANKDDKVCALCVHIFVIFVSACVARDV